MKNTVQESLNFREFVKARDDVDFTSAEGAEVSTIHRKLNQLTADGMGELYVDLGKAEKKAAKKAAKQKEKEPDDMDVDEEDDEDADDDDDEEEEEEVVPTKRRKRG